MNGHERRRRAKRKAILEAAAKLFSETGIDATTVDEIAAQAGASKMTIYNYFGSKDKLVYDLLSTEYEAACDRAEMILASDNDFDAKTQAIMALKGAAGQRFGGAMMREAVDANSALRRYIDTELASRIEKLLRTYFAAGRDAGRIHRELSDDVLLVYYDIFSAGMASRAQDVGVLSTDPERLADLMGLFFYGLAGRHVR
jgi:AcrR family transcriptional regulator